MTLYTSNKNIIEEEETERGEVDIIVAGIEYLD